MIMKKEQFLTVRWNNLLSLLLGIPALAYVIVVSTTSILSEGAGFFGLVIIGILYWMIVEYHTNMRFAWQKKKSTGNVSDTMNPAGLTRLVMVAYNIIWWIPIVLTFTRIIDYQTGFIAFLIITIIRLIANLIRNNVLTQEQAEKFPLRMPWIVN